MSLTVNGNDRGDAKHALHVLYWQIVDKAAVNEHMPVGRVANRRQIAKQRHAGTDVAPQRALGWCDTVQRPAERQTCSCARIVMPDMSVLTQ